MRQTIHHGDEGFASVESVPSGIVLRVELDAPDPAATPTLHMTRRQATSLALALTSALMDDPDVARVLKELK